MAYLEDQVVGLVLGCGEDVGVADEHAGVHGPKGQQEDEIGEAVEEGHAPDEGDQGVGAAYSAQPVVVQRPAHSDVALHRHAG